MLEVLLADLHNDVGEHLDETAVGVIDKPCESGIGIALDHGIDNIIVQAQIQNGIHHAGHGGTGAGTDGDQQRVGEIAELLAVDLLHLIHVLHDLGHDLIIDFLAVLVVLGAGLRRNSKALGNRQSDSGHFRQIRTLATQKLSHGTVTLGEQINILMRHTIPLSKYTGGIAIRYFLPDIYTFEFSKCQNSISRQLTNCNNYSHFSQFLSVCTNSPTVFVYCVNGFLFTLKFFVQFV